MILGYSSPLSNILLVSLSWSIFPRAKENEKKINTTQFLPLDPDAGVNGEIRYSLQLGPESLIFEIDAVSGRITTKNMLDYEKQKLYSVTVIATDRGTSPRRATTVVSVNIVDVNDNKPIFSGLPYSETVKEDASKGTLVKSVIASDDDSGTVYCW